MPPKIVRDSDRGPAGKPMSCSIGVRIEQSTVERLDDICYRMGTTRSAIVKRLIREFVEENAHD